ncbi:PAS domain S-box protein [Neobacillus drentensis]|uniref:PAS domain S-box protein n=1 Tax=Neobacillus drentensis TaxID=220684 RepID=UPI003000527B
MMNDYNPYFVFLVGIFFLLLLILAHFLFLNHRRAMLNFNITLFQSFILQNPNAIISLDSNGRISRVNAATEKLFGYSQPELVGKFFTELIHSSSLETALPKLNSALKGKAATCKINTHDRYGGNLVLMLKFIPIIDHRLFGVYVVVEDYSEREKVATSLQESMEQLQCFFTSTVDAINITNVHSEVLYVNPAFEKMYGWTSSELVGAKLPIIPDELWKVESSMRQSLLQGDVIRNWETQLLRRDGSFIDVNVSISPLRDAEDRITGFVAITRDETERKSIENRYKIIAENSSDLIRLINKEGIVTYASPAHQSLLGYNPDELVGRPFHINIHPEDTERTLASFEEMVAEPKTYVMEYRKLQKDGRPVYIEAHCDPFLDEDGKLSQYIVVSRDVSERKQYEQKLEELAYVDPLTGVANRRAFYKQLGEAIDVARGDIGVGGNLVNTGHNAAATSRFALFFLDLDRFKWVNDTMGHDVGDELLKQFIERVQAVLPEEALLCRLGGDEFAIIYSWADSEGPSARNVARLDSKGRVRNLAYVDKKSKIDHLATRVIDTLQAPWSIGCHSFTTTCSIGISLYPEAGEDQKTLMSHADYALYQAKADGRNLYRYYYDGCGMGKDRLRFKN